MNTNFTTDLKQHFQHLSLLLFNELKNNEAAVLNLAAENDIFVRFNANKVRQNTNVEQKTISLKFQKEGRETNLSWSLTGQKNIDAGKMLDWLKIARSECEVLPADPHFVAIENHGTSDHHFQGALPSENNLIETIVDSAKGSDLAGLYCAGPVISANANSKGQRHWFSSENFFMDYSLFNQEKAAKGTYAGNKWNNEAWLQNLTETRQQLSLLDKPVQNIKPGPYRVYLAPAAVAEILGTVSWGGVSAMSWKIGVGPFKKLADGEKKFSPLLTLRENFKLGMINQFNALGELSPDIVTIINNGNFGEFLTNSRTAKEYKLKANGATDWEGLRSTEILPGELTQTQTLKELGTGLYLSNLHYINWSDPSSARLTGMTRYACFWVENGEIIGPIKDLRFDVSLYEAWGANLLALTNFQEVMPATLTYSQRSQGGMKVPGMLIKDFNFTL